MATDGVPQEIRTHSDASTYAFGPFRVEIVPRALLRGDIRIPLTRKVFDTLLFLIQHRQRTVTKDELVEAVWPNTFVSDDSLVRNVSAIRRALGDDASQPQYVATMARRGYRFIRDVASI
jgi:DNA-binding winged helix-turn-helix (wHTH) protein